MGCTPCAAKRARRKGTKYLWTDGTNTVRYDSELAAKSKVQRKGGSYKPVQP